MLWIGSGTGSDSVFPEADLRIRIHNKMKRIRNTETYCKSESSIMISPVRITIFDLDPNTFNGKTPLIF